MVAVYDSCGQLGFYGRGLCQLRTTGFLSQCDRWALGLWPRAFQAVIGDITSDRVIAYHEKENHPMVTLFFDGMILNSFSS